MVLFVIAAEYQSLNTRIKTASFSNDLADAGFFDTVISVLEKQLHWIKNIQRQYCKLSTQK